jgi:transcriptional regulator with XRE-family HTH domain
MKKRSRGIELSKKNSSDLTKTGNRIRYLRGLMGLDRPAMKKRHQISASSMEKWECGLTNIKAKNIQRLISAALDHSIECTSEWLMNGDGPPPRTILASTITESTEATTNKTLNALRDLKYFKDSYPNGISLMITDDAMAPFYVSGDFVGGEVVKLKDLKKCLDFPCIVHTADGKARVRRIGYSNGEWFLYGTNVKHEGSAYLEINVEITKAAPIFWVRMQSKVR